MYSFQVKIALFILSILSGTLFACAEYNLYKTNKSFASIPISDQDSTSTCFAYTATTLLDTERFEGGIDKNKRTHPLFAAYIYHMTLKDTKATLSGGYVAEALRALAENKICFEGEGHKQIEKYKGINHLSDAHFMNILEQTYDYFSKAKRLNKEKRSMTNRNFLGCSVDNKSIAQNILGKILEDFSIMPENIFPTSIMGKILKKCTDVVKVHPRIDISKLKSEKCFTCTDDQLKLYILNQLKRNKPVAVSYCSKVLNDKFTKSIKENNIFLYEDNKRNTRIKKDCWPHASIVAGSRTKGGKCQMLVRNTWGDWKSSTWKDCLCETSKGYYEPCKKGDFKLNSVGCWVDADALTRNTYRTTHF